MDRNLFASEKEFRLSLEHLFRTHNWMVGYTWNSRNSAAGEPDLRLIHVPTKKFVVAELKMPGNFPTWPQIEWLDAYLAAGIQSCLWYPTDWDAILEVVEREYFWFRGGHYIPGRWEIYREAPDCQIKIASARRTWERREVKRKSTRKKVRSGRN